MAEDRGRFEYNPDAPQDGRQDRYKENMFKLPFGQLQHQGFIHPKARRSLTSEEMRLIKRRLFQKMSLADLNHHDDTKENEEENDLQHVILVTSSKPAEGKSFTALNLALSIILDEKYNVLLIDADIARASISRRLRLQQQSGLTDLLREKHPNIPHFIKREINFPLSFIPAGSGVATATDLFGGKKMRRFVHDIANRYKDRIIIFDAPPLLASTEAIVLAQHVGQIIYVIDGSETPRSTIEAGLDILGRYDNVGLVLNKTSMHNDIAQFGAYYDHYFNQE
ncbi:MAG: AAA family ATPase [Pseudomonadota bacterium]